MLLQEIREIKSGRKERHQFGLVIGGALVIIGVFLAWGGGIRPVYFIAALVVVAPVLIDKLFKTDTAIILLPFQKVWMSIAVVMGFFMSRLILGLMFFGAFTAIRVINGLLGKRLLDTAWNPGARDSYWITRDPDEYDPKRSERQF